jgi:hypothetical protein
MSIIARLGVWLGINTTEFVKGLDDATKKTREFERNQKKALKDAQKAQEEFMAFAAKGLAGVAAAALAVGKAFQYADEIEDTAAAYDVATESLIALQAAMQGSGGDAANVGTSLQKLASAQQGAIDGSDELRESFEKLGISGKDVENLKLADFYKRVVQELAKVEDTTQRAALQQELLGKAMKGVDVRTFVDKYKEMGDPALTEAIKENAKAWDNIELAFKNIAYFAQIAVAPLAKIVNSYDSIAKRIKEFSNFNLGITGVTEFGITNYGNGEAPSEPDPNKTIAPAPNTGNYSTQTSKQTAAAKKAADEAKRIKEAREALQLEISLIEKKAAIAEKMYAVNMKAVSLGSDAVAQEKMLLDLASDIEQIRSNAAKERSKEKAQIDLINAKETAEITARNNQYSFDNEVRRKQKEREHNLALAAIQAEGIVRRDAMAVQALAEHNLLDLESKRFELGSAAYDLQKLDVDLQNKLAEARLVYLEKSKEINTEYEQSAKNASDLEKYEARMFELKTNQSAQINYIYGVENKRKENLKEQYEIEAKMFSMDLAQQKGRDIANIQSALNVERQRLELENNRYLMSTNQYNLSNLALENIHRLIEAEKKYNDQMKEAEYEMKRQGGGQKAREEYEQRIKNIEEIRDIELDAIDQINNARQRNLENEINRQRNFVDGWHYAAKQFQENSENAFKRGEAAFSSVMSSMDAAISNFVETGKFKFEDFALGIVKDLIKMEAQAQASMLFRSIVGMFSPAGIKTMNYDAGVSSIPMAAAGGYIDAPTIVGENGAELFIPNTPGTVIPNGSWQQAAASMNKGGFTNNGTYIANMSAIDTQSATQFLASNKSTIWAAYQSANRSVPISR